MILADYIYFIGFIITGAAIGALIDKPSVTFIIIGLGAIIWASIQIYFYKKYY